MNETPENWIFIEEVEGSFVFENSNHTFTVFIDFNSSLETPYVIGYEQLEGDYELIEIEEGVFTTSAQTQTDAQTKAFLLMNFINEKFT